MRVDTPAFAARNLALAKDPRYVIELSFNSANTVLRYFTSHADAALPDGAIAFGTTVQGLSGTSQKLNTDLANASIGNINFRLVDRGSTITAALAGQIQLGRSTRLQRVRIYVGYQDLAWADYTLVQTQLVQDISFSRGAYVFRCVDVQREMRKDIFDVAKTSLTASLLKGGLTVNVISTSFYSTVQHGTSYSDATSAEVGYIRIEDEIIRWKSKTATTFVVDQRGALNTLETDHLVDPTAALDRQTPVEEYVYLELPSLKVMYALLTGTLYGQRHLSLPGVAGNYASTPDTAANSITGDIDIRVKIKLNDWTPSSFCSVVTKVASAAAGFFSWSFGVSSGTPGLLQWAWSTDGTAFVSKLSTVIVGAADGSVKWVRVVHDVNNGAGGNDVKFYTSDDYDPAIGLGTWTQLGATVTTAGTTSIFDSTSIVEIGSSVTGTINVFPGKIYYTEIRNGIDGTVANAFNAQTFAVGATSAAAATGEIWTVNQSGGTPAVIEEDVLPTSWNLGIDPAYVRLSDFTDPAKIDLWNPADDAAGFVTLFQDLKKIDGKKFIETELALLCGVFMPIYASGEIGCKRLTNILTGASYVAQLDESNIVDYGDLLHDFGSVRNILTIHWNWDPLDEDFSRENNLIDLGSFGIYKKADPLDLSFRGLHGSRHTASMLQGRFDALRDRYSGPPLRIDVAVLSRLNQLEVGDVVRLRLSNARDYLANLQVAPFSLDRSFEIQGIGVDWITGALKLQLMASSRNPDAIAATSDATVLTAGFYTGTGTALTSVLTITGSSPGHVSASGSLTGNANMLNAGAIYYYDGDLQIDAGVVITISNNVQLRVKGFLQINGRIDGRGRGLAGAAAATAPGIFDLNSSNAALRDAAMTKHNDGTQGFIGATEAGGGVTINLASVRGAIVLGRNAAVPVFNLVWDGSVLDGLPSDMRGSSGSSGMPVKYNAVDSRQAWAMGAAGGAGGAALCIICRGMDINVAGRIDLSGVDGSVAPFSNFLVFNYFAGSGAGGAPGGLLVLLDGTGVTATGLNEARFVALNGSTPIPAPPLALGAINGNVNLILPPSGSTFYSYYVGTGDGTTFPVPSLSGVRGAGRVQYVPGMVAPAQDVTISAEVVFEEMAAANWIARKNPKQKQLLGICWSGSTYVAVGEADGADAYLLTSEQTGVNWTERANAKNFSLFDVVWSPTLSLFVAVGDADGGDAYLLTSPTGVTWTERANPKNLRLNAIAWSPQLGLLAGVGNADTDAYIVTSSDGTTWTERTNPKAFALQAVAWGPDLGLFVAVGNADGTDAYILTSQDGIIWTERANPKNLALNGVCWYSGTLRQFVAVGTSDGDAYIVTSPDGVTWTERANPNAATLRAVVGTNELLVAVGDLTVDGIPYVMTSRDHGAHWVRRESPVSIRLHSIVWSGLRFVAVGDPDVVAAQAYVVTSLSKG